MPDNRSVRMHISVPADVRDFILARARERGVGVSAVVAESVRNTMLAERQARLDEALALDSDANLAFARQVSVISARIPGQ